MKIFVDTNVILEEFLQRENFYIAHRLFVLLHEQKHELYMSAGSFYTIIFLVDKFLRKELVLTGEERISELRKIMSNILMSIQVAGHDNDCLLRGVRNMLFKDIEDGCQYELAINADCEYLITFNVSDYPESPDATIKVLTPAEFVEQVSRSEV